MKVYACHSHYGHLNNDAYLPTYRPYAERNIASPSPAVRGIKIEPPSSPGASSEICNDITRKLAEKPNILRKRRNKNIFDFDEIRNLGDALHMKPALANGADKDAVFEWITECSKQDASPVVLSYKFNGQEKAGIESTDFIIVLQTDYQKMMLQGHGNSGISIQTTLGDDSYNHVLSAIVVVDEYGECQPAAWCISSQASYDFMKLFFECTLKSSGKISPSWVMTDLNEQFYKSFCDVYQQIPQQYVFSWTIKKLWRKELSKESVDVAEEEEMYTKLCGIVDQSDPTVLEYTVMQFLTDLSASQARYPNFSRYFSEHWAANEELWSSCYRGGNKANAIQMSFFEELHQSLCKDELGGFIDLCLLRIVKCDQLKITQHLEDILQNNSNHHNSVIHRHHTQSVLLSKSFVTIDSEAPDQWLVYLSFFLFIFLYH